MIYLVLNILCAVIVAILFKISEVRNGNKFFILFINYLIAFSIAFYLWKSSGSILPTNITAILGILNGILFIVTFLIFITSIAINGVGISVSIMRLAVIIPIILSVVVFSEKVTYKRGCGIFLALFSLYLIGMAIKEIENKKSSNTKFSIKGFFVALSLFMCMGSVEFILKLFDEYSKKGEKEIFFLIIFGISFLISIFLLKRDRRTGFFNFFIGLLVGIFNYSNLYFFVKALSKLPAVVVFPVTDVSVVALTVMAGKVFWNEKIPLRGYLGLTLALLSLFMIR